MGARTRISMNYLTLIRQARDRLDRAYALSQNSENRVMAETLCLDAAKEINWAVIEMRKDDHRS